VHFQDAADDDAISEHVEIVIVLFARRARSGGAFEDEVVLIHRGNSDGTN
jgi:hypothetical protein